MLLCSPTRCFGVSNHKRVQDYVKPQVNKIIESNNLAYIIF